MTTLADTGAATPSSFVSGRPPDHRGSWIPTWGMVTTRFMELRKRRGLMIALIAVNIGVPVVFLAVRLISHAVAPKSYGPAGGYSIFTTLVAGIMFTFGFIVAAVVGCTAGSVDLGDGMFRHLVITGRSRLALYLARIPAGLAIVISMVAIGYTIVCAVCVFAAPTQLNYNGVNVPQGLSRQALDSWAATHADQVICNFNYNGPSIPPNVPCGNGQSNGPPPGAVIKTPKGVVTVPTSSTPAQIRAFAISMANQNYSDYRATFTVPPTSLMIDVGLWIALEATIGFLVGLGLSSLMGQRTVPVILLIVLELILTPALQSSCHFAPAQRGAGDRWCGHDPYRAWRARHRSGRRWSIRGRWGWAWRQQPDTRVDLGVVAGDHWLDCVLDRDRRMADDDSRRLGVARAGSLRVFDFASPCLGCRRYRRVEGR